MKEYLSAKAHSWPGHFGLMELYLPKKRKMGGKGTFVGWEVVHYKDMWYCGRAADLVNEHHYLYRHSMKTSLFAQCICWLMSFPPKYKLYHCDFIIKYWEAGHIFPPHSYSSCLWLLLSFCVLKIIIEERGQNRPGRNWEVDFKY